MLHPHCPGKPSPALHGPIHRAIPTPHNPQYICTFAHPANVARGTLRRGWLVNCWKRFASPEAGGGVRHVVCRDPPGGSPQHAPAWCAGRHQVGRKHLGLTEQLLCHPYASFLLRRPLQS